MASTDDTQVSRSVLSLPSGNSNLADENVFHRVPAGPCHSLISRITRFEHDRPVVKLRSYRSRKVQKHIESPAIFRRGI